MTAKPIFVLKTSELADEDRLAVFIRGIERFITEHNFTCVIRPAQMDGKDGFALITEDFIGYLKLKVKLLGDSFGTHGYTLSEGQNNAAWLEAAKAFMQRQQIDYREGFNPPHFAFNWTTDLIAFAQAAASLTSIPDCDGAPGVLIRSEPAPRSIHVHGTTNLHAFVIDESKPN